MSDVTDSATPAQPAAGDAPAPCAPPALTKENNLFMQIKVNPDGTVTRPEVPQVPASPDAPVGGGVVSRDVPLDASLGTYLRLYLPSTAPAPPARLPVIFYLHGGGFVVFSAASVFYHAHCEALAAAAPALVASLEYRLAPEHRLPAAYDDAAAAVAWLRAPGPGGARSDPWVAEHADLARCFLMGGSSGGNMAFFVGLRLKSHHHHADHAHDKATIRGLLLHQPYLGGVERTASEASSEDDIMLPLEANDKLWSLALPLGADRDHQFCNPAKSLPPEALEGLPPCLVTGNRGDPLIDRQREFVRWLRDQGGVEVVARQDHEGFHASELFVPDRAQELFAAVRDFVSAAADADA